MIHTLFFTSMSATASRSRRRRRLVSRQLLFQLLHSLALREDAFLGGLIGAQNFHSELIADGRSHPLHQLLGVVVLLVDGQAHAHAELGVVFEQRVRPGRPAPFGVHAVRASSAGCRRRWTSSRSRCRSLRGRRTAASSARCMAFRRNQRRRRRTRTAAPAVAGLSPGRARASRARTRESSGSNPSTRCTSRAAAAAAPC